MTESVVPRYAAIIIGTVLWDVGAVLQKKAMDGLPRTRPRVVDLARSAGWMAGLLVTGLGWGLYVYGLAAVPVSTARTITGGSYVVLALFSLLFLKTPLRAAEWLAVVLVSGGIVMIGLGEPAGAAGPVQPVASLVQVGMALAIVMVACAGLLQLRRIGSRSLLRDIAWPLVAYAAVSGLLLSVGDLLMKVILIAFQGTLETGSRLLLVTACGFGLAAFYLAGFYMLSRAYQSGGVVGGVVISDFFARIGAIFLGAMALAEPLAAAGSAGLLKAAGLVVVLVGSLLLGRFSGMPEPKSTEQRPHTSTL